MRENAKKTILLVAMPGSIHVVRWIRQLNSNEWDIHLFPSNGGTVVHPEMSGVTYHYPLLLWPRKIDNPSTSGAMFRLIFKVVDSLMGRVFERYRPGFRANRLLKVIRKIRPDFLHTLEMQAAGYLTLDVKKRFSGVFPEWLVTNWGSDIFLFGRLPSHQARIREVLANCDYYSCECERDVSLAKQFGFTGQVMPVFPNTGGFELAGLENERNHTRTSDRKVILLKGYQDWAGRALVGLRALERCRDILSGYTLMVYLAAPEVSIAAELFAGKTGIPVRLIPKNTPHREMLSLHAQARVSIGLSISDAISTSFLEAVVMGSFPIQSCTACADEWIQHGVSGMTVPPEDPDVIETALRTALLEDDLVNEAAKINWQTAQRRLNADLLRHKSNEMYRTILKNQNPNGGSRKAAK